MHAIQCDCHLLGDLHEILLLGFTEAVEVFRCEILGLQGKDVAMDRRVRVRAHACCVCQERKRTLLCTGFFERGLMGFGDQRLHLLRTDHTLPGRTQASTLGVEDGALACPSKNDK